MTTNPQPSRPAPARVLPVITIAQFAGTSVWFAANAVMPELQRDLHLPAAAVGTLTSAVQLGFICGTLLFALLAIADRYSPRRVFLLCSLAAAACAVGTALLPPQLATLVTLRALTGFFLAGIYPVGMKIAASWYGRGLGAALGLMLGALVIGTATPHGLRAMGTQLPWQVVMFGVALLAAAGGLLLYLLVPDSPHAPPVGAAGAGLNWRALGSIWLDRRVRASVFGYFGHMWELYTFWVFVPVILATRLPAGQVSLASFAVIAIGGLSSAACGLAARRWGSAAVAFSQLATSGLCCIAAPAMLPAGNWGFGLWIGLWGATVASDSPQFSALTAHNAPPTAVGSVLTLSNSIGFAISIVSIQLFVELAQTRPLASLLPWLGIGPLFGLAALWPLVRERA